MTSSESQEDRPARGSSAGGGSQPTLSERILAALHRAWRPVPPALPDLDPNLAELPAITRVAETLRYSILDLEQAISPNGGLRAWVQLNMLVALVLAVPAFFVIPIVTLILSGFVTWSDFLARIGINLLTAAAAIFGSVLVLVLTGRVIEGERKRRRRR